MITEDEAWRLAIEAASLSTCVRRRVGAVLVSPGGVLLSTGYNEEREELRCDRGECPRGHKSLEEVPPGAPYDDCVATHAEVNALQEWWYARLDGSTLYVTEEPCYQCRDYLKHWGSGIRVLVKGKGEMK